MLSSIHTILIARKHSQTLNFRFGINAINIITDDVNNNPVKLAIESWLDLVSAVLVFFAAIIPAYLSLKLKGNIRKVTITLTAFIVVHGIYHVVKMQGIESIADSVLEPASVIVLIAFGLTYLGVSYEKKRQEATGK
jgi:lipopolysaccharide export LptBFGC system permease protein LptF